MLHTWDTGAGGEKDSGASLKAALPLTPTPAHVHAQTYTHTQTTLSTTTALLPLGLLN